MQRFRTNTLPITLLVVAIASVIAVLVFASLQPSWATAVSILSIVLGWLLKAVSDTVTEDRRRQWELELQIRERTLKYYETKLDDLSQLVADEIRGLNTLHWQTDAAALRLVETQSGLTQAELVAAVSARTFVEALANRELGQAYRDAIEQLNKLNELVRQLNLGTLDSVDHNTLIRLTQAEAATCIGKLKTLQLTVERTRIKALRGELTLDTPAK